jgi:hypothetical protein
LLYPVYRHLGRQVAKRWLLAAMRRQLDEQQA